ncbi:unnamed protein product [Calypogeia fissa]
MSWGQFFTNGKRKEHGGGTEMRGATLIFSGIDEFLRVRGLEGDGDSFLIQAGEGGGELGKKRSGIWANLLKQKSDEELILMEAERGTGCCRIDGPFMRSNVKKSIQAILTGGWLSGRA